MAENKSITNFSLTDLGTQLLTRGLAEGKVINITNAILGNGICTTDPKSVTGIKGSSVFSIAPTLTFNVATNTMTISVAITNLGFTKPILVTEIGIYAKLTGDSSEVLFAYKNSKDTPFILNAYDGSKEVKATLTVDCVLGSAYTESVGKATSNSSGADTELVYLKKMLTGLLGIPQTTFNDSLPDNSKNWGWFDGGEIKKTDYPDLWLRVKPEVDNAVANVTNGIWEYGGVNNLKSYFGWYKGTTDEYFRKPNMMESGHFVRPSSNQVGARKGGVHQVNAIQAHNHSATSGTSGSHYHTGSTSTDGNHTHTINYGRKLNGGGGGGDLENSGTYATFNAAGAHAHSFTTSTVAGHSHTITVGNTGGTETIPPNIAVKVYGLLRF